MKVILSGATGFIGQQVLRTCLENPHITSVVSLARRDLRIPRAMKSNSKLKAVIHNDFSSYPETLLDELKGAEACIWCLGVVPSKYGNVEEARKGDVDYPVTAANAFEDALTKHLQGKKFRFIYLSGALAERDKNQTLWFMQTVRLTKGEAENQLLDIAVKHSSTFEAFIAKPAAVLANNWGLRTLFWSMVPSFSIQVDVLAAAMTSLALNGNTADTLWRGELEKVGKAYLAGSS